MLNTCKKLCLRNFCFYLDFNLLRHRLLKKKLQTCLDKSETRSQRLLIKGYSNSVISCDGLSIDQFLCNHWSVFVLCSSLNGWLDVLHLEYHFIACFIRLCFIRACFILCCWLWAVTCLLGILLFLISFVDGFSKLGTMFSINNWVTWIKIFTQCVWVRGQRRIQNPVERLT